MAGVSALVAVVGVAPELVVEALGSGSKVICIAKTGPLQEPLAPLLLAPEPLLGV